MSISAGWIQKVRAPGRAAPSGCFLLLRRSLAILMAGIVCAQAQNPNTRPTSGALSQMAREMLAAHNAVRAEVKIPPLQWSGRLAAVAQKWADTLLSKNQFMHSGDTPYGENLFDLTGAAGSPAVAVRFWASEARNYSYSANSCSGLCGHYTQIVWRATKYVGCAVARGRGREVWVCEYDPPGNWLGQRPY